MNGDIYVGGDGNTVLRTWVAAPRSLSMKTDRSRTALTVSVDAPATDGTTIEVAATVDAHHITSVLSALSWSRFERIQLEILSTQTEISADRVEVTTWRTRAINLAIVGILVE